MKQRIKKAFNVKDARNGATVETKDGHSVRIICYDRRCVDYPLIALVNFDKNEQIYSYNIAGILYNSTNDNRNLIVIEEIESKFDEGDYIVSDIGNIYKITRIDDMYHTIQLSSGYEQRWTIEDVDRTFHKWSLDDIKPGDVLCCEDGRPFMFKELYGTYPVAYFGIDLTNHIYVGTGGIWCRDIIRPATFKEYNSLFKQLRKENYEYNVDTHEITKQNIAWRNREGLGTKMSGYYIGIDSKIYPYDGGILYKTSYNVFATKKQVKAALAMARISQIMTNDKRFGGTISNDEVGTDRYYVILRRDNELEISTRFNYEYLAFHTKKQAELFLKENEDLIKDYYMMD